MPGPEKIGNGGTEVRYYQKDAFSFNKDKTIVLNILFSTPRQNEISRSKASSKKRNQLILKKKSVKKKKKNQPKFNLPASFIAEMSPSYAQSVPRHKN